LGPSLAPSLPTWQGMLFCASLAKIRARETGKNKHRHDSRSGGSVVKI
jgi:hypothetical protein